MRDPSTAEQLENFWKSWEALKVDIDEMERRRDQAEAPPSALLRLPFEIRLKIYHCCIPRKRIVGVSSACLERTTLYEEVDFTRDSGCILTPDSESVEDVVHNNVMDLESSPDLESGLESSGSNEKQNSVFVLSKQISGEALDILYGDNVFKVYLHGGEEYGLKGNFTEANRQRMRHLLLVAHPRLLGTKPDDALWSSIVPNLTTLRIVAEQPVRARPYFGAPTIKEEVDCWIQWIKPFLQCFGQYVSRETIVQVDIDGQEEAREIVQETLPYGYQEIQCSLVGDLMFRRGQSWDSGYWDDVDGPTS